MGMIIQIVIMFAIGLIMSSLSANIARTKWLGLGDRILAGLTGSFMGGLISISGIIRSLFGVNAGGTIVWASLGAIIALYIISLIKSKPPRDD